SLPRYSLDFPLCTLLLSEAQCGKPFATVTGVQTCALPISALLDFAITLKLKLFFAKNSLSFRVMAKATSAAANPQYQDSALNPRSEERRVGKWGRFRYRS